MYDENFYSMTLCCIIFEKIRFKSSLKESEHHPVEYKWKGVLPLNSKNQALEPEVENYSFHKKVIMEVGANIHVG